MPSLTEICGQDHLTINNRIMYAHSRHMIVSMPIQEKKEKKYFGFCIQIKHNEDDIFDLYAFVVNLAIE